MASSIVYHVTITHCGWKRLRILGSLMEINCICNLLARGPPIGSDNQACHWFRFFPPLRCWAKRNFLWSWNLALVWSVWTKYNCEPLTFYWYKLTVTFYWYYGAFRTLHASACQQTTLQGSVSHLSRDADILIWLTDVNKVQLDPSQTSLLWVKCLMCLQLDVFSSMTFGKKIKYSTDSAKHLHEWNFEKKD